MCAFSAIFILVPFHLFASYSLPISFGFLIRAIFPGRSHVNFRRPMTRQARGAQTSMIFRERVSRAGREQNSRSAGRATNPTPILPAAPLCSSLFSSIWASVVLYHDALLNNVWYSHEECWREKGQRRWRLTKETRGNQLWRDISINILWHFCGK